MASPTLPGTPHPCHALALQVPLVYPTGFTNCQRAEQLSRAAGQALGLSSAPGSPVVSGILLEGQGGPAVPIMLLPRLPPRSPACPYPVVSDVATSACLPTQLRPVCGLQVLCPHEQWKLSKQLILQKPPVADHTCKRAAFAALPSGAHAHLAALPSGAHAHPRLLCPRAPMPTRLLCPRAPIPPLLPTRLLCP
jgi:hypothetical protein